VVRVVQQISPWVQRKGKDLVHRNSEGNSSETVASLLLLLPTCPSVRSHQNDGDGRLLRLRDGLEMSDYTNHPASPLKA
jgi:hypothetical protein